MSKSKVSISYCKNYHQEEVDRAVDECLSQIGGIESIVKENQKVLLKVNMISASSPDQAVTTHPTIVKSMVKQVLKVGGVPLIGDSPGNAYVNMDKAFEITGFKSVALETGALLVKFTSDGIVTIPNPGNSCIKNLYISKLVLDCDVIISLPKLKTHNLCLYTGAIKNMFGTVTGFHKGEIHCYAPKPEEFARAIVDIFTNVKPKLSLIDAVVGMEGHGPTAGTPRQVGLIGASFDSVALDSVFSKIIGYNPEDIDIIKEASSRNLGVSDLNNIEILGPPLSQLIIKDYKKVKNANLILKYIPKFILNLFGPLAQKLIKIYPSLIIEKCKSCFICLEHCPVKAISKNNNKFPVWDYDKCIYCYCCHELCPHKAIEIKQSWLARKWVIGPQDS